VAVVIDLNYKVFRVPQLVAILASELPPWVIAHDHAASNGAPHVIACQRLTPDGEYMQIHGCEFFADSNASSAWRSPVTFPCISPSKKSSMAPANLLDIFIHFSDPTL